MAGRLLHKLMLLIYAYNNEFDKLEKLGIDKSEKRAMLCKRKHDTSHNTPDNHCHLLIFH